MIAHFKPIPILLMMLALISCSEEPKPMKLNNKDVVGVYLGRYFDGYETVEIRLDGTFKQIFEKSSHVVYTHEGRWTISSSNTVHLAPFMSLVDLSGKGVVTGKPTLSDGMAANFRRNPDRIEFGEWPYIVTRKK